MMNIYLVIEDTAFYTPEDWPPYIPIDYLNSCTHSIIWGAYSDRAKAEAVLKTITENEAEDWGNVWPERKQIRGDGSDEMIDGLYLLGSFYYIQECELDS